MRIWALYLPQFYEIPENNEWWEPGYTEWSAVKRAKPIYPGHMQPLVPLDENYYDLSQKEAIQWQADLAQKYGIEGFVCYHYWYQGRHLLEKPCEILLNSPEIGIHYCFCWANHTWTRAWDGKDHEILIKQTYGDQSEWEEHFLYLLPFFKDERYLRIDGKLVLFLYKARDIPDGDERIAYWNRRLKEEGLPPLYVVEFINTFNAKSSLKNSSAVFEDQPACCCRFDISVFNKAYRVICKTLKITDYQSFDKMWKLNLKKRTTYGGKAIIRGGFPCWDNSPRRGRNSRIIFGSTPDKFKDYLSKLVRQNRKDAKDIIVLNAWNEWGEGAILEPTEQYKYAYLEAVAQSQAQD